MTRISVFVNQAGHQAIASLGMGRFDQQVVSFTEHELALLGISHERATRVEILPYVLWETSPVDIAIVVSTESQPMLRRLSAKVGFRIGTEVTNLFHQADLVIPRVEAHLVLLGYQSLESIVRTAEEFSELMRHEYLGSEHLLYALTTLDGQIFPYSSLLEQYGVTTNEVSRQIDQTIGRGNKATRGSPPKTPNAVHLLSAAGDVDEASTLSPAARLYVAMLNLDGSQAVSILEAITEHSIFELKTLL